MRRRRWAAVYAGEKGSALLAIGKGMRDLRHAEDLNGSEGTTTP
jgi:hypothetical protein